MEMPTDDKPMGRRPAEPRLARARQLRRDMTAAENVLWRALRNRGIGAKFRRQVPIGPYNNLLIGGGDIVVAKIKEFVAAFGPHPSRCA